MILAQIPTEVLNAIPPKYLVYATAGWVLFQSLGRIWHAIASGGGIIAIWRGLIYGTNTPKEPK